MLVKNNNEKTLRVKNSWCWWCKGKCGVKVYSKENKLIKVELNSKATAGSFGVGCNGKRLKYAVEWFYSKHRLNYPLKRVGLRGENKWKVISWDTALDEISEKLDELKNKYGPETLVISSGDSWTHDEYKTRFLHLFGSPNIIGPSPICMGPRSLVCEAVFGWYPQMSVGPKTKCVVALGCNIFVGRPGVWVNYLKAKKNGAKLITIDPRKTETASKSDLWLQLKPGTDVTILMAMIDHIIKKELYDKEFVKNWCYGFEELVKRAAQFPPDMVAEISGVPAEKIREAAEMYATNKPAAFVEGMGVEQQVNSAQIIHARCILAGITGNLDIEGGEELPGPHSASGFITDRQMEFLESLPDMQRKKQISYDKFKLHSWPGQELLIKYIGNKVGEKGSTHWYTGQANQPSLYKAILSEKPYPIKAMICSASNPIVSHTNTSQVYQALKKLDLFVVFDLIMNPSAQLADYVLPAASWLERPQLWSYMGFRDILVGCHAALPSLTADYDRKTEFDFWRGLGIRLGQEKYWPWGTLEESYAARMEKMDISFDELCEQGWIKNIEPNYEKYKRNGFNTPTGKVELYSTIFEELGYDPLPYYKEIRKNEVKDKTSEEYPLMLINGSRVKEYMQSLWREVPSMRKRHPYPIIQIHPETAKSLNIDDGDWVWIETKMGRVRQKCKIFAGIEKNVVHADGQWWYPEIPGEEPFLYGVWLSNINVILNDNPDEFNEITGSWPLRHTFCKIYK